MIAQEINYTLQNIQQAAEKIWGMGKDYPIWSFVGDMGVGKTTLISAIAAHIGVKDAVSSPTYAIVNEYQFQDDKQTKTIYHCDWYRLKDANDARNAGMEDILNQKNCYAFIEWASIAQELLQKPYIEINIKIESENNRIVELGKL